MKPEISVVVCTYNPNRDYLVRTLDSLRAQVDAPPHEVIVIDNNSDPAVESWLDGDGLTGFRVVCEPEQGLTQARTRAATEVEADFIIFVDDDNILEPSYLATASRLSGEHPRLGLIGAARLEPEFEVEPGSRERPYTKALALRTIEEDYWSNDPGHLTSNPWGAGFCVRKPVLEAFAREAASNSGLATLGRRGNVLLSGEDIAFAWIARRMELGTGNFTALGLKHIIPAKRVAWSYLLKTMEGHEYSALLLNYVYGGAGSMGSAGQWKDLLRLTKKCGLRNLDMALACWKARRRARRDCLAQDFQMKPDGAPEG